jgi:hypothetical protein
MAHFVAKKPPNTDWPPGRTFGRCSAAVFKLNWREQPKIQCRQNLVIMIAALQQITIAIYACLIE